MSHLANAATLLLDVAFGLAALLFLLRMALQGVGAPFRNPICQATYRYSNPVLMPLRKVFKPWRRIDVAAAVAAFAVMLVKAVLLLLVWRLLPNLEAVLVLAVAELSGLLLMACFWLILARVIVSWVRADVRHPAIPLLLQLSEPLLRPLRRILPALGSIDLSPMLAMLLIALARILLVAPLQELAIDLAVGAIPV